DVLIVAIDRPAIARGRVLRQADLDRIAQADVYRSVIVRFDQRQHRQTFAASATQAARAANHARARAATPGKYSPAAGLSHGRCSERHAVALIEEARIDIGLAGVGETTISPGRAPAVADDEATVGGVADDGDGVAAADGVGLEHVQFALGRGGV